MKLEGKTFILNKGVKNSFLKEMQDFLIEFFEANIKSEVPVYPEPKAKEQLIYTTYK